MKRQLTVDVEYNFWESCPDHRAAKLAIGHLATWGMCDSPDGTYMGPCRITLIASTGEMCAYYTHGMDHKKTTFVLGAVRGEKGQYTFHS